MSNFGRSGDGYFRAYKTGSEKRKLKKQKLQSVEKMKGSLLKFMLPPGHGNTDIADAEPEPVADVAVGCAEVDSDDTPQVDPTTSTFHNADDEHDAVPTMASGGLDDTLASNSFFYL